MSFEPAKTSGLKSASAVISAANCRVLGAQINPAAADATLIIYDNKTAASGPVLFKLTVKASTTGQNVWFGDLGIAADQGAYASLSGAGAEYLVYYSAL